MTVVPGRAKLSRKKRVGPTSAWRNGTFCKTTNTIGAHAVKLSDTMPVKTATIVLKRVLDVDDDLVTPVSSNDRARLLAVDEEALNITIAIWITSCVRNFKVVSYGVSCNRMLLVEIRLNTEAIAPTGTRVGPVGASSISHQ